MIPGQPSVTAQRAAMRRALHQLIDTPRIFDDPLAMRIIGATAAVELEADPARFEGTAVGATLRAFLAARSRFAEDALALAVERGASQYVILAAGLDTFAYRNPHRGLRVFEVDHPATQTWKRERLAEVQIAPPRSLAFVGVDFAVDDLVGCLGAAGFDERAPAVFSWLGAVPYLELETVNATLRAVASLSAAGSGLVFDYATSPNDLPQVQRVLWDVFAERVRAAGEPLRCFLDPASLVASLEALGYTRIEDLDGPTLARRYRGEQSDERPRGAIAHVVSAER